MQIKFKLNQKQIVEEIKPDMTLYTLLRKKGCYSVKCGCETTNCGLCTVLLNGKPVLSCSVLVARVQNGEVFTLEGLKEEALEFGTYLADQGAEQCGFCSPGFIMNVLAMKRELKNPTESQVREYLAGNLCRCTGYMGQMRAIANYLSEHKEVADESSK